MTKTSPSSGRHPHVEAANRYIKDVLAGRIPACRWVKLACRRQVDDLKRAKAKDWPYRFDAEAAERVCRFLECLPHIKGPLAKAKKLLTLEPWQCFVVTTAYGWVHKAGALKGKRRFRRLYLEVPRGNGKALDIDTPIATPSGWKRHGDLSAGDLVFGPDGFPRCVLASSGIYEGPCRTVAFSDGTEIAAHERHEWRTRRTWFTKRRRGSRKPLPNVETAEIAATLRTTGARSELVHSIEVAGALQTPAASLPVEPYVLGVWLGDGGSASARITACVDDAEIVERLKAADPSAEIVVRRQGRILTISLLRTAVHLNALGIYGSGRKAIPSIYLRASIDQRKALLQGLMDTDGTVSKEGQCEFSTTSTALRDGFLELARSLGYKPTLKTCRATIYGRDCGPNFRIQFWAFAGDPVFRLTRKINRQKPAPRSRPISKTRTIVSADPAGVRKVNCIEVEGGMYLAGAAMVPTHNSALLSGLTLYALAADGEIGAEVYSAAVSKDQAKIIFDVSRAMVRKRPKLRDKLGLKTVRNAITREKTDSTFKPLASDADNLDGLNVHFAAIDELHAHPKRAVYDVVESGMGKREQPMLVIITTAGTDRSGICYEVRGYVTRILQKAFADESWFGIVYTIDIDESKVDDEDDKKGDDWRKEEIWRKANPNWGVSVDPVHVSGMASKAMQLPSAQANFKTKHLNVWVNADSAWMNMAAWNRCANPKLNIEDFEGEEAKIALDLASVQDIAAKAYLFKRIVDGKSHFYYFGRYYLPEATIAEGRNAQYEGWRVSGVLTETEGNAIDFDLIEAEIKGTDDEDELADAKRFGPIEVAYDPWQARQLAQHLEAENIPTVEYRMVLANMSAPMKEVEAAILQGRLHHNGCPLMTWMVSNVVCHKDGKDNVYPRKERDENKIDGPVAMIMAMGRWMLSDGEEGGGSIYNDPTLWEKRDETVQR